LYPEKESFWIRVPDPDPGGKNYRIYESGSGSAPLPDRHYFAKSLNKCMYGAGERSVQYTRLFTIIWAFAHNRYIMVAGTELVVVCTRLAMTPI
jgi:hypothetical protein